MPTCSCSCSAPARRRRPTASLVLATAALVVALGGTSYAASVAANSVGNKQLKNNAVTSAKIASGSVTRSDIRAGNIYGVAMAPKAVTGAKIADNAVTGSKVADSSLGSADIANGAINNGDIAGGTIDNTRIADNTIGLNDIEHSAIDALTNLPAQLVTHTFVDPNNPPAKLDSLPVSASFTDFQTWATSNDDVGKSLVLAQVSIASTAKTDVTCQLVQQPQPEGDPATLTSNTITVPAVGRAAVTLMAMPILANDDAIKLQCQRSAGDAVVDLSSSGATAITVIRIAR